MKYKIKHLIFIPILLFLFSLFVLSMNYRATGDFIQKDIDLTGGTLISMETPEQVNAKQIENVLLPKYGSVIVSSVKTIGGYGLHVETDAEVNATNVIKDVEATGVVVSSFSVETVGPVLGQTFWKQVVYVITFAFILMGMVVFLIYKSAIPSFAIVTALFGDMLAAIAVINFFGMKMGFAGFGALLMIAYALDTNVILTTSILKSDRKDFMKIYKPAFITGLTMTACIVSIFSIVWLVSSSRILVDIARILVVGFSADLIFTWVWNAGILQWWLERSSE